jgi:CRISPR system Cascade subunit CasB
MTITDVERVRDTYAFVASLGGLNAAARARLKRNAGRTLSEARDVYGIFYRLLPPRLQPYEHDHYFLVATLFPLGTETKRDRNFGATLRITRQSMSGPALDRRVETLLDADAEQLPFRLRQAVRLAQSHRVGINWNRMLVDVLGWGAPSRYVQRQWAESYFRAQSPAADA